jgi:outer membrane protein assembly factor BamD
MRSYFFNVVFISITLLFLTNCATKTSENDTPRLSATEMYNNAALYFKKKQYKLAANSFAEITYQHPYYKWAARSRIMELYSYYMLQDYDAVIYSADQYTNMYPASAEIAYVYYMKALAYYEQIDIPYRDQEITHIAKQAFLTLVTNFPRSEYSKDGKIKLELIDDHLAAHEMIVGRFYMKTGDVLAAITRFRMVAEQYSTTSQIEEALHRLVEGYVFLGIIEEAKVHAAILHHNYPHSPWYPSSYELIKNSPEPSSSDINSDY